MKKFWIILLSFLIIFAVIFFLVYFLRPSSSTPNIPYTAEKTQSVNQNLQVQNFANNNNTSSEMLANKTNSPESQIISEETLPTPETKLASFSTPLKSKANSRRNNIDLTASILNGTQIAPGETFSFNQIVGKPSSSRGYQKADTLVDGKTIQAIGGGNCQVSTTIYNTATQVPDIEILERHNHSKEVPYIESGKDAAVSYGSLDLKFKNNGNHTLKLIVEVNDSEILTTFYSI